MNLLRWFLSLPPRTRTSIFFAVMMTLFTVWSMISRPETRAVPIAEFSGSTGTTKSREFTASQTQWALELSVKGQSPVMAVQVISAETGQIVSQSRLVESGGTDSKRRELNPKTITAEPGRYYIQVDAKSDGSMAWTITVVGLEGPAKEKGEKDPFIGPR